MKISKVRILPNYRKPWAIKLARKISTYLKKNNFYPSHKNVDATICIGGDGSIFFANHRSRIQGAVLGIGSKTSVVCQLRKDNWKNHLLMVLKRCKTGKHQRLAVKVGSRKISSINDIVLHTRDYRVIRIFIQINGKKEWFDGDGIIVSTPIGSTAYAYSAGGKVLRSTAKKIELVPICPYKRTIKSIIIPDNAKISISADRSSELIVDGIRIKRIEPKQSISIEKLDLLIFLKRLS